MSNNNEDDNSFFQNLYIQSDPCEETSDWKKVLEKAKKLPPADAIPGKRQEPKFSDKCRAVFKMIDMKSWQLLPSLKSTNVMKTSIISMIKEKIERTKLKTNDSDSSSLQIDEDGEQEICAQIHENVTSFVTVNDTPLISGIIFQF